MTMTQDPRWLSEIAARPAYGDGEPDYAGILLTKAERDQLVAAVRRLREMVDMLFYADEDKARGVGDSVEEAISDALRRETRSVAETGDQP